MMHLKWISSALIVATILILPARSHAETVVVPKGTEMGAVIGLGVGQIVGTISDYIAASAHRTLQREAVRAAIENCGQCSERGKLEAEYNRLEQEEAKIRAGEGIVLQTLGLPYKDFRDLSKALYQQSLGLRPGYDVMPPEVREARMSMQRAISNYCYAANDTPEKEAACRQVLPLNTVTELALSAPKRCVNAVEETSGASLHVFPPPQAGETERKAHADAWARYSKCLKDNELFEFFRTETHRVCGVEDIGPTLDRDQFVCACRGRSPPEGAKCSGAPPTPAPIVIPALVPPNPVLKLGMDGMYGPELVGIRLGMSTAEAEAVVRKHMRVGREFVTGVATQFQGGGYRFEKQLLNVTSGLKGRLFIREDGYEAITFFDAPPYLDGRVVMAARSISLPGGAEKQVVAGIIAERGTPSTIFGISMFWGDVSIPGCTGMGRADNFVWVADGHTIDISTPDLSMPWWFNTRSRDDLFKCGPVTMLEKSGDPSRAGRPVHVVTRLFDVGLLAWYQEKNPRP